MNLFPKTLFSIKKPTVVFVSKSQDSNILELLNVVLENHFKSQKTLLPLKKNKFSFIFKNDVLIIEIDFNNNEEIKQLNFLVANSNRSVFIFEKELSEKEAGNFNFFSEKTKKKITVIVDSKNIRKINFNGINFFKVGSDDESNLQVSDLKVAENSNFKISHDGDIVPFWINESLNQGELKSFLFSIATGMILGLNLVEISQKLK